MLHHAYRLVELPNGSRSVRSLAHGETFHPVVGPVAEAEALYVRQLHLRERVRASRAPFVIWDVGLGGAANSLTVLRATRDLPCPLRLVSFDLTLDPLAFSLKHRRELAYFDGYEEVVAQLATGLKRAVFFEDGRRTVEWELYLADFPNLLTDFSALCRESRSPAATQVPGTTGRGPSSSVDGSGVARAMTLHRSRAQRTAVPPPPQAILFDPYSPARNPGMWTLPLFLQLYRLLDPQRPCAMPTYSRSTLLRVTLLLAGFFVGAGHATGEKEETTIAANTLELIDEPLDASWLQRARRSTSAEPLREPVYRQARMSAETWEKLQRHPQFA